MKVYPYWLCLCCCLLMYSCERSLAPAQLVAYIQNPDNGLHKNKKVGQLQVDLQYQPTASVIANELRKNQITQEEYEQRVPDLESLQYFTLKLSVDEPGKNISTFDISHPQEEQERLYYLSFLMKHDIRLIEGQDTLAPVLYHFERSYDLADHRTFVMAFENKTPHNIEDKTFVFHSDLLGTGPIKLKFKENDLQNTPQLKLL